MNKKLLAAIGLLMLTLSACATSAETTTVEPDSAPRQTSAPPTELPAAPSPEVTAAPPTETPTQNAAEISFANDVTPILNEYCVKCHGVESVKEGLDLTSYEALMQGSFNGEVVVPGDADGSLLVDLIAKGKMPKRGAKPGPGQIQIIRDWVNAGAPNN